jgi:hypothetical protein
MSIDVGAHLVRDQINHRNRGQDPLLQVHLISIACAKAVPTGASIDVGAHRMREGRSHRCLYWCRSTSHARGVASDVGSN